MSAARRPDAPSRKTIIGWRRGFLAKLEEERIFADRVSVPVPFELGPLTFGLAPHGWGKYR